MQFNLPTSKTSLLLLAPALLFLIVCYVVPVSYTFALTVSDPVPGLGNFVHALDPLYLKTFRITFEIAVSVALISLLIAYPTALFIVTRPPKTSAFLLALVVIPFLTSLLVRNYAWLFILGGRGVINSVLSSFGLTATPLRLMFNRFGVLVGMTHVLAPYLILILITALRSINPDLVRAAASLGSGPFGQFRQIILPQSRAAAGTGVILVFVVALGFFITPGMLGSPQDAMIANVISSEMGFLNWGFAATLGLMLLAVTLVAVALMQILFGGLAVIAPALAKDSSRPRARSRWGAALSNSLQTVDVLLDPVWRPLVAVIGTLTLLYLVLPVLIVVPLSFSSAEFFVFPPPGWTTRWYTAFFSNPRWTGAAVNSLFIAVMTVAMTLLLAVPAALGIARTRTRLVIAAYLLIISPMIVPTIITAISIFFGFSRMGIGRSALGIAVGHTIGALPLAVLTMVAAFSGFDWTLERAAQSLGASRARALFRIVLPIVSGALATAAFLAFLHSFDDLLVSLFLGGLRLETLPRRMWESLQEINPTIAAVSTMLIVLMVSLLILLQAFQLHSKRRLSKKSLAGGNLR